MLGFPFCDLVTLRFNVNYFLQEVEHSNDGELFRMISGGHSVPRTKPSSKGEIFEEPAKTYNPQASSSSRYSSKVQTQKMSNNLDNSLQFIKSLEENFRQTMSQSSYTPEATSSIKKTEEDPQSSETIFTLDDLTESKETVVEQSITREPHPNVSRKASRSFGEPSVESLQKRKPEEVTVKLFQLKSKVVNLIDQTISQIESNEDSPGEDHEKSIPLHPSGDGSTLDYRSRNLEVLKTDSFARSRKDIRTKLYREIRVVLKRLEDLDSLE